jgi:hypothetical protein
VCGSAACSPWACEEDQIKKTRKDRRIVREVRGRIVREVRGRELYEK